MRTFRVAEHFASANGESSRAGELAYFVRFTRCNLSCSYCDTAWANGPDAPYTEMTAAEIGELVRRSGIRNVTLTGGEPLLQEGIEEVLAELLSDPAEAPGTDPNAPASESTAGTDPAGASGAQTDPAEAPGTDPNAPASESAAGTDPAGASGAQTEPAGAPLRVEIETNGSIDICRFIDINGKRPVFTLDYKVPGSGMSHLMNTDNYRYLAPEDAVKFVVSDRADLDCAREIIDSFRLADRCHVYLSPVFGKIEPEEIVQYMLDHRMNGVTLNIQLHKIIWDPDKRGV